MISRRDVFGLAGGLMSASWLCAQDPQRPVFWVKLSVSVTDSYTRHHIAGLKPNDFRVLEDGIPQRISTFREGANAPLLVNADGTTSPLLDPKAAEGGKQGINLVRESDEDLENSYTITYYPDHSNHNQGFRNIKIEVVPAVAKNWRVKCRPGYRPRPGF